jgi:biopolymer transport protein TolR
MEAGVSVALPSITTPDEASAPVDPATVSVARDGRLFLEKELIEPVPLLEKLRALHEQKPAMRVVIKADAAVDYGKVRDLFRACQDIGFPGASLQVIDRANKKG